MKAHEPNLDMLSAYLDGLLSPDAERSMQQHLERCDACAGVLRAERSLLATLDAMSEVEPPADFVNAVMGRVAQYPAHRPAALVPWREAMRWSVAASVLLLMLFGGGIAWLVGSGMLENADPGSLLAAGIGRSTVFVAESFAALRSLVDPAMVLIEEAGKMVWRVLALATTSGWIVQATLLLLTVSLNYAFTRLVRNYQRRH